MPASNGRPGPIVNAVLWSTSEPSGSPTGRGTSNSNAILTAAEALSGLDSLGHGYRFTVGRDQREFNTVWLLSLCPAQAKQEYDRSVAPHVQRRRAALPA